LVGDNSISYHFIKNGSSRQSSEQVQRCFLGANFPFYRIENLENDLVQIRDHLSKRQTYPYLLSYEAPYEGDDMIHPVSVDIVQNKSVSAIKSRYVVDRERAYNEDRFPCGISITLDWDEEYSSRSITKHIAGFNPTIDKELHPKHKEQIRSFALGTHRFFFEADKATLPTLLDQSLSAQLSVASLFENPKSKTEDQLEQLNEFEILPSAGLSVFAPLPEPGNDWATFENNFQTCLYSEFIDFERQKSFKKVDVWETSDIRTFSPSKKKSFEKTLEATSLLALSESSLFHDSTFNQLKNRTTRLYTDDVLDAELYPELSVLSSQSYLNHLLYDSSFESKAYWKINKSSGALLGIMPDGSGGGIEVAIAHNLKIIDSYAGAYNKAAAPLMSDPLAFGTVTMYGQFLARLYGLVCVAVLSLDTAQLPADSRKAIKKLAYGVIKSFAFAKFGKLKNFEKILDKLFDPGWPKIG
ncbi:MAG: hypothetical protein P8P74_09130, partial [Crocinitomicaceae bacterium]|nr:hypothetical protein [Crocinitomicaceae bacterium]